MACPARSLGGKDGHRSVLRGVTHPHAQRPPGLLRRALGEAERVLARMTERGGIELARLRAQHISDCESGRATDGGVARLPDPNALCPPFMPISSAMGPLTITQMPGPPVLVATVFTLNDGSRTASMAVTTIGKYSGRQPAITAFTATISVLTVLRRAG